MPQIFLVGAVLSLLIIGMIPARAQDNAVSTGSWYPVPYNAKFLTGDSWQYETVTYRLWGVQSCLRGTKFINAYNKERDCGEASLVVLASMIKDLKPACSTVTEDVPQRTRFVVCLSTIQSGPAKGQRIDLATALITQGYAFAAHTTDGSLVHVPYGVAEEQARDRKAGLWQFDFPNPNAIIARTLNGSPAPTLQRPTSPKP